MKIPFFLSSTILIIIALTLSSFSLEKKPKWKKIKIPKSYAYVPSGNLHISPENKLSINGFYMSKTEISNKDYNEFLKDLLKQNNQDNLKIARRKTENWESEPFQKLYHLHPAYAEYPVVTISKEGAKMYCKWLEKKIQEKNPKHKITIRLPSEKEWMYAAQGGHQLAPYPWGGYYVRNAKGCYLANFKHIESGNISYDRKTKTYEVKDVDPNNISLNNVITTPSPVKSFHPNDYGLYNMSGNAAEMLSNNSKKETGGYRTKGGCYDSVGAHIQINGADEFDGWIEPSQYIGFRPLISVRLK